MFVLLCQFIWIGWSAAIFFSRPSVTTSARYFGALVGAELVVVAVAGAVIRRFFQPTRDVLVGGMARPGMGIDRFVCLWSFLPGANARTASLSPLAAGFAARVAVSVGISLVATDR